MEHEVPLCVVPACRPFRAESRASRSRLKATAPHRHQSLNLPKRVNSRNGRGAHNIPGTSRARLQKLAGLPVVDILATAKQLRDSGNDVLMAHVAEGKRKAEDTA